MRLQPVPGEAAAGPSTRSWLRSFGNLAIGEGISGVARFAALIVTARALGPSVFGFLNVGLVVGGYLVVSHSGLDVVGTRDVAARPGEVRRLTGDVVGLEIAIAILVLLVAAAVTMVTPLEGLTRNLILLYSLSLITIALDIRWLFIGLEKTVPVAVASSLASVAYLGGVLALVHAPDDVLLVPILQVASEAVLAIVLISASLRRIGRWRPQLPRRSEPRWRRLFAESLPIAATKAARGLTLAFDVILIGLLRPPTDVGQYGAARRLTMVALVFLGLYTNAFLPLIARAVEGGHQRASQVVGMAMRRTGLILVPCALVGTIWAPFFLRHLVGEEYVGATSVLRVLIWSMVVVCFAGLYAQVLLAYHQQKRLMAIDVAAAVSSILLNLALVPTIGLVGAAVAALAARVITLLWTLAAARPFLLGRHLPADPGEPDESLVLPDLPPPGLME